MKLQAAKEFLDALFFQVKGYAIGPGSSLYVCRFPLNVSLKGY